jgi:putative FmdB family regulatory protein
MPIHEYKCPKCGVIFEKFTRLFSEEKVCCPVCGSEDIEKLPSRAGLIGAEDSDVSSSDFGTCGVSWGG